MTREKLEQLDKILQEVATGATIHNINNIRYRLIGFFEDQEKDCKVQFQHALEQAYQQIKDALLK